MNKKLSLIFLSAVFSLTNPILSFGAETYNHPVMHINLDDIQDKYEEAKSNALMSSNENVTLQSANYSLKQYMHEIDETWDQGDCGSCWVWASTLASEIAYSKYIGSKSRFSVQYFISNFCNGGDLPYAESALCNFACYGGQTTSFSWFYNDTQKLIPFTNSGASDYQDIDGGVSYTTKYGNTYKKSHVLPSAILTTPFIPVSSIKPRIISTFDVTDDVARDNIKRELLAGNSVLFSLMGYTTADWNNFKSYWGNQNEDVLFDLTSFGNKSISYEQEQGIGGHLITITGFNDTDPDPSKHYWIVQNSWGVPANRPNGEFRIPMNFDYDTTVTIARTGAKSPIAVFEVYDINFDKPESVVYGHIADDHGGNIGNVNVSLNDTQRTLSSKDGSFVFDNVIKNTNYTLTFMKQGYLFNPSVYTKLAEFDVEEVNIEAMRDPAYQKCKTSNTPTEDIISDFTELEKIQNEIQEKTRNIAESKKDPKKRDKILSKINSNKDKMRKYLDKGRDSLIAIPNEIYTCKGVKNCTAKSHKQAIRTMRKQIPNITKLIKADGDYLVENNSRRKNFVNKKIKKANEIADELTAIISHIPGNNYFCESAE